MSDYLTDDGIRKLQRMLAGPKKPGAPPSAAEPPAKGQLGKYRLLRMLGPQAWEATDGQKPNALVVKLLGGTKDNDAVAAMMADLKPLSALKHPVIVGYHKLSTIGGHYFTVRDFVLGDPADAKPLDPAPALQIAYEVARAIEFIHQRGLAHGNLASSNVILSPAGRPFVVDVGADMLRRRLTQGASAPPPDPQKDLADLQTVFVALLAGVRFEAVQSGPRPPLRPVHGEVDRALVDLAICPPDSAKAFADALGQLLQKLPSAYTTSVGLMQRFERQSRA